MNETPTESNPIPVAPTFEQPVAPIPPHTPAPQASKLGLWSMILGIGSLVLALLFFVSLPAAIAAIILGIMTLVKHRPGKGMAIAGIITGGLALLVIPILLTITIAAYNGVTEKAKSAVQAAQQKESEKVAAENDRFVDTECYSYAYPEGYEFDDNSKGCITSVNIPKGDTLTRIVVKGNTGTIGTLNDVATTLNNALLKGDPKSEGVIDKKELNVNGSTAYYITYKDATGLLFANYIFPYTGSNDQTLDGKPVTAYTVAGYVYNEKLKELLDGVVDSLDII